MRLHLFNLKVYLNSENTKYKTFVFARSLRVMNEIETRAYPYFLKPVWQIRDGKLFICMIVIIVKKFYDATYITICEN